MGSRNASGALDARTTNAALSREGIIERALLLADEEGLDSLSIRKIAASFGKSPMALYRHVESMEDIRLGMASLALREVDADPLPGELWEDTLRRTMSSIRASYVRHARARLYTIEAPPWSDAFQQHNDRILSLHRKQGIPEEVLGPLWRIVEAYLLGFIADECHALLFLPDDKSYDETQRSIQMGSTSDRAFMDGIDIIVAGVRALAAPNPCEWRTPQ